MSANPKRRDLELAVIDAAISYRTAFARAQTTPGNNGAAILARQDLITAVDAYCGYGLAEPRRTRTVMSAPSTSHEAGEWMKQFALTDACAVFRQIYFTWRDGMSLGRTCDEIESAMERTHQTISARVNELRDTGWIRDSGTRRKTRSGRAAIVWRPTTAAIALVDRAGLPIPITAPERKRDT